MKLLIAVIIIVACLVLFNAVFLTSTDAGAQPKSSGSSGGILGGLLPKGSIVPLPTAGGSNPVNSVRGGK